MIQRHNQEKEILSFLEAAATFDGPVEIGQAVIIQDVKKNAKSLISIIKAGVSKKQYDLAVFHAKRLKDEIT